MLLSNATCQPLVCHALLDLRIEVVPSVSKDSITTGLYAPRSRCPTSPPPNPSPVGRPRKERALSLLIDAFSGSAISDIQKAERKGQLHFLATVFANISTVCVHIPGCLYAYENSS